MAQNFPKPIKGYYSTYFWGPGSYRNEAGDGTIRHAGPSPVPPGAPRRRAKPDALRASEPFPDVGSFVVRAGFWRDSTTRRKTDRDDKGMLGMRCFVPRAAPSDAALEHESTAASQAWKVGS